MKFTVKIKPSIYTGYGTKKDAFDKFRNCTTNVLCPTFSSKYGNYYGNVIHRGSGPEYAYCYNLEVFKRGKYRKNKHFVLYVYRIDLRILDLLNMEINQHSKYFRIVPKNK